MPDETFYLIQLSFRNFPLQADRLCDEMSGFVEYGFDLVQQGGTCILFFFPRGNNFVLVTSFLWPIKKCSEARAK